MMRPPLQLKQYFFTKIEVAANPSFRPDDFGDVVDFSVKTDVAVSVDTNDATSYQVAVGLEVEPKDERPLPYTGSLSVVGFFKISDNVTPDQRGNLVTINGVSILYSAAREFLLMITGRGPWQPLMLPTDSFLGLKEAAQERAGQKKAAKKTPVRKKSKA